MRTHKIISLSVVILLITVLFAGVAIVPAAAQYDTMQFHYNAQRTGDYSPVAGSVLPNNKLKWSYTTGGSVDTSPAVVNGVVYVGSWDSKVYALNATTGTKLWEFTTESVVDPSPAVTNGVVYVGSGVHFYALSTTTGTKLWEFTTESASEIIQCSPAVANGVVYVGSSDGNVFALSATTGTKLWEHAVGGAVQSSAYANGVVYIGSMDGKVYALNAATGAEKWSYKAGVWIFSSPAVVNGVVYIGSWDGKVYALNATTGKLKWSYTTGGGVRSSPAVVNGVVYVGSYEDHKVYALNATTGKLKWSYTTGGGIYSSPAYANGVVYIGSEDYKVYALNATTGALIWEYATKAAVHSSPAVVNGVVYIGSADHKVYAIGNQPAPSRITLTASTTTPTLYQPITLTAKLYWWNPVTNQWAPVSAGKSVTIYHYLNGVRYNDKTINTDSSGKVTLTQSFSSAGQRTYYATFAGDTSYKGSTSSVLNVNVKAPIRVTLAASTTTPAVGQSVTFSAKLYWWNSATTQWVPVSGKSVTIYHYLNGVKYTDTTKTTNANGQITLTQSFSTKGQRTYYATFAGDTWYKASKSAVVTINVH